MSVYKVQITFDDGEGGEYIEAITVDADMKFQWTTTPQTISAKQRMRLIAVIRESIKILGVNGGLKLEIEEEA